jgi:flotillin
VNEQSNEYLAQVVQDQARVEGELNWKQAPRARRRLVPGLAKVEDADLEDSSGALVTAFGNGERLADYRITGFWLWKTVVVPPNVYVVHTRRGYDEPLDIGMGISFRFNPYRDAFLVIPAAVQTLLINARCICAERQGVLVQGYVQWIIDDIRTAYRRLDFSDPSDPMRVVNVQLREQAEAAIKDKVATMPIDEVLSDKQPIIEELTSRLRPIAEGNREGDSGLGLKIVTVQIKEAVVSSTRLWENLQKPFRAEREKQARLAEMDAQQEVARRELENRQVRETAELEHHRLMARLQAEQEREVYDRDQAERARRYQVEQQAEQQAVAERTATERVRQENDLELVLQKLELENRRLTQELEAVRQRMELDQVQAERDKQQALAEVDRENLVHHGQCERTERDLALFRQRRATENDLSEGHVRSRLIERLPEIANSLPRPDELRAVSIGNGTAGESQSLLGFLAGVLQLAEGSFSARQAVNGQGTE